MAVDDHTMTRPQAEAVFAWLREVADMIGLKDWETLVDTEGPSPDPSSGSIAWASCTTTSAYRETVINVSGALLAQSDHQIRCKLVHELVHCFHSDLLEALDVPLGLVHHEHRAVIEAVIRRYVEDLVDKSARAIVRTAELPPLDAIRDATDDRLDETRSSLSHGGGVIV